MGRIKVCNFGRIMLKIFCWTTVILAIYLVLGFTGCYAKWFGGPAGIAKAPPRATMQSDPRRPWSFSIPVRPSSVARSPGRTSAPVRNRRARNEHRSRLWRPRVG